MILQDKCFCIVVDFCNFQDCIQCEVKQVCEFVIFVFVKDFVEFVDNFDCVFGIVFQEKLVVKEKNEDFQEFVNFYEGLKMIEIIFMQIFVKYGLFCLDFVGEKFNFNEYEVIFMVLQLDKEDNIVFYVQQKGFKFNGWILCVVKVGVVKNK